MAVISEAGLEKMQQEKRKQHDLQVQKEQKDRVRARNLYLQAVTSKPADNRMATPTAASQKPPRTGPGHLSSKNILRNRLHLPRQSTEPEPKRAASKSALKPQTSLNRDLESSHHLPASEANRPAGLSRDGLGLSSHRPANSIPVATDAHLAPMQQQA